MPDTNERFGFGNNWKKFIEHKFSEERLINSTKDLLTSLRTENLEGQTFLDIGCGSGLHSYAAWRSGAKKNCKL